MSVTATPIFPQAVNAAVGTIANADGTTVKTVLTAGTNGSKVEALTVSSTDTSDRVVNVYLTRSAVNYLLCTLTVPLSSGNDAAVSPVDVFHHARVPGLSYDANGNRVLYLKSGDTLSWGCTTTVTSGKTLTALAQGGDY